MGVALWFKVYIADEMCSGRFFVIISGFTGNSVRRTVLVLKRLSSVPKRTWLFLSAHFTSPVAPRSQTVPSAAVRRDRLEDEQHPLCVYVP
jgi:hypothetical protein